MIAPSPDWFTGVADVRLLENGTWVPDKTLLLQAWDAGTDNGVSFRAPDADTQPRGAVRPSASAHFLIEGKPAPLGTVRFRRL